jgi:hypothetical protein
MNVERPRATKGQTCPLHKKDMSTVCHKCPWWTQVRGKHPQSEEIIDQWGCAIAFLPILLIENTQMERQTGAAVESARNEHAAAMRNFGAAVDGAIHEMLGAVTRERETTVATVQGAVTAMIAHKKID